MLFNILYRAGERCVKCLPRSCTCLHYRAKDILFLMITINIAFCSFHFHYLVRK